MTVGASEAFVAFTSKLASRLALALAVGAANIGRDIADPFWGAVGSDSNSTAVNHCRKETSKQKMNLHRLTSSFMDSPGLLPMWGKYIQIKLGFKAGVPNLSNF